MNPNPLPPLGDPRWDAVHEDNLKVFEMIKRESTVISLKATTKGKYEFILNDR